MTNSPSMRLLPLALILLTAAPASAHDWRRAARAEYAHELSQARAQVQLDGCPLLAAVESQRLMMNQQVLETYNRRIMPPYGPAGYGIPVRPRR